MAGKNESITGCWKQNTTYSEHQAPALHTALLSPTNTHPAAMFGSKMLRLFTDEQTWAVCTLMVCCVVWWAVTGTACWAPMRHHQKPGTEQQSPLNHAYTGLYHLPAQPQGHFSYGHVNHSKNHGVEILMSLQEVWSNTLFSAIDNL